MPPPDPVLRGGRTLRRDRLQRRPGWTPRPTRSSPSPPSRSREGRRASQAAATGWCDRTGCPTGKSIRIHGLRPSDLESAPSLDELLDELLESITGSVLVAHVASVERGFLRAALGAPVLLSCATRSSTRRRWPRSCSCGGGPDLGRPPPRSGSATWRGPFGFQSPAHHADGDALTTGQVFLALATHLDEPEPLTVAAMQEFRYTSPRRSLRERLRRVRRELIPQFGKALIGHSPASP